MKHHGLSPRHQEVLTCFSCLPRKMIALQGSNHIAEFVLHQLAHKKCCNLIKAAYFVDNPDFDCFKGVAGYHNKEHDDTSQWENKFNTHVSHCKFNSQVRDIDNASFRRAHKNERHVIDEMAKNLTINNPRTFTWDMKHDNHGILVYELAPDEDESVCDHLQNGLYFLSFCPVF